MGGKFDVVIRGGTVVDGTGSPARVADVAISDGRIAEVGTVTAAGREEIDARDRIVIPGFVDVHTHYDAQVTWASQILPSSCNGVTTVLMGNCGVGFAPVRPEHHDMLISLMEGVEDIPEVVMKEGLPWNWSSFPDYLDSLEGHEYYVDVATQVPHAALRVFVMGERGAQNEKASAQEVEAMAAIVKEGLQAGALGFSTTRTILHRAKDGELAPGTTADREEVIGIGRVLGEVGFGVFEVASDLAP